MNLYFVYFLNIFKYFNSIKDVLVIFFTELYSLDYCFSFSV